MRALSVREEPTRHEVDEVDTIVVADDELFARERIVRLDDPDDLGVHDRPTLPVPPPPFESGVRLGATVISVTGATVDVVTADMSRDPRSEDYIASSPPSERSARRHESYVRIVARR
jgi:hypothetical protein